MRSVKFTSDRGEHKAGAVVELDDESAQYLVDYRFAVDPDDDEPEAAGTRTQGEVVSPTLDPNGGTSSGEPAHDRMAHTVDGEKREPGDVIPHAMPHAGDPNVPDPGEAQTEQGDDGEYDPARHTVADVNAHLDSLDDEDEVARILQLETEGKNRAGIVDR